MGRTFYTDYVSHCMRYYARYPHKQPSKDIDILNWSVCKDVLDDFSDEEKEILLFIYRERDCFEDNVYQIAKRKNIHQDTVWNLVKSLEIKVAKARGLI
ncbi:MAG: hypothetical protein KH972_08925 [Peptostreptococcaceae bacterium]|nr:hypothetical protein [Peptostreptococcaceae bacterium]